MTTQGDNTMITLDDLQQTVDRAMRVGDRLRRKFYAHEHSHEVMQCDQCPHTVMACVLESSPRYHKRISAGFNVHGPGDGEPPEYDTVCPDCGAIDSFAKATVCAECGDYPCTCGD